MSNAIYPTLIGLRFETLRNPRWTTTVQRAISGKRTTIAHQFYPRMHFDLKYEFLRDNTTPSDLKSIVGLYNSLQGAYDTFLFTDPDFNTISAGAPHPFGTGNGVTTAFQLKAFYANTGGEGYYEMIQALNGTPVIYDNGATVNPVNYSIGSTGIVTFTAAPAATHVLTWSGSFYYRCAFDEDQLDLSKFVTSLWESAGIAFTQRLL